MASNAVEKLKALGLRHGEKAGVGLAAALCVLLLVMATGKETIQMTPEQVKKAAEQANANINKSQPEASIIERLEQEFLKKPEFAQEVEKEAKTVIVASNFKARTPWVSPEPGAGLLRDDPVLIAVSDLYAYPGRGGVLMYELKDGERVKDDGKGADEDAKARRETKFRKKKRRSGGGMMGGSLMAMGGGGKSKKKKSAEEEKKEKEAAYLAEKKQKEGLIVGGPAKKDEGDEPSVPEGGPWKEKTVGKRWVALTGTIDHKQFRDNYLQALKRPEAANPRYKRLDVQRQVKQADGTWSEWEDIDAARNEEVILNLPEQEEELAPENTLLEALVDPLPFLKAGVWQRVHVGSLVAEEKVAVAKPDLENSSAEGMPGMSSSMSSAGMPPNSGMMMSSPSMESSMMGSPMMGSPMMGGMDGMASAAEESNFPKSDADTIMIRSLDFTVEPDTTYRYRVRIVVYNPNHEREDTNPGVNRKDKYLKGPWSEPSVEATMPADLTAYALKPAPNAKASDVVPVQFQVTKWNPEDGVTVVRTFDAAPGDIVGEYAYVMIPTSDGSKAPSKNVDFNTSQVLLDSAGGTQPLPAIGVKGNTFEMPVLSLLLRPDGSVVARNQAMDYKDEVRKDIVDTYEKEKKESGKKRENSYGESMGSFMGSAPGMPGRPPGR